MPAGFHYIDGTTGDLDEAPLEDRRMLAEHGVVLITAGVDKASGRLEERARVTARGWFEGEHEEQLMTVVAEAVNAALLEALDGGERDAANLTKVVQRTAGRLIGQKFRRQPVIMPAVVVL